MPQTLYRVDSDKVVVRKSVISGTGFVVGKDYQPDSTHDGDIGITVRLNCEKLKGPLTPEQRTSAARIFREAVQEVGAVLGDDMQPGFPPGTVVSAGDVAGVVQSVNASGLFLRRINGRGKETISFIPFLQRIDAVPDVTGMDGLLTAIAHHDISVHEDRGFLKLIIERIDDEETLFAAVTSSDAGYHDMYEPAIAKINDPIRLAKIIVAIEKHPLEEGSRKGRKIAALKLTDMIETLTPRQRREIVDLIDPTITLSQDADVNDGGITCLREHELVSLYLALFSSANADAQEIFVDMALGKENICSTVREIIIREYLNDESISTIANRVLEPTFDGMNRESGGQQRCAAAIIDRLPINHIALEVCVTGTWDGELVKKAVQKITDIVVLEKLLLLHEKPGSVKTTFASIIRNWMRSIEILDF